MVLILFLIKCKPKVTYGIEPTVESLFILSGPAGHLLLDAHYLLFLVVDPEIVDGVGWQVELAGRAPVA